MPTVLGCSLAPPADYAEQAAWEAQSTTLAQGKLLASSWEHAPANITVQRHGAALAEAFWAIVQKAHKQPAQLADRLALIETEECAREIACDATLCALTTVRETMDRQDLAAKIGRRAELIVLLRSAAWGDSWHGHEIRQVVAADSTAVDLLYRFRSPQFRMLRAFKPWKQIEQVHMGFLLVELLTDAGLLCRINMRRGPGWQKGVLLSEAYRKFMKNWRDLALVHAVERWPMLCPPEPWVDGVTGGYLTIATSVFTSGGLTFDMQAGDAHDEVLEAVNRIQAQPVSINREQLDLLAAIWDGEQGLGSMPSRVGLQMPISSWKTRRSNRFWRDVYQFRLDQKRATERSRTATTVVLAEKLAERQAFWRVSYLDKRGRIYYRGNLSMQQPDHLRSLLQWPEGCGAELHSGTEEAFSWAVGQAYGVKPDRELRLAWLRQNGGFLRRVGEAGADALGHLHQASEPWQFAALAREYAMACRDPRHKIRALFRLDQTCSAYGHVACLLWDQQLGQEVNVTGSERGDVYLKVLREVEAAVDRELVACRDEKGIRVLEMLKAYPLDRSGIKPLVMPLAYGARKFSLKNSLLVGYRELIGDAVTEDGVRPMDLATRMARIVFDAGHRVMPGLLLLSEWLRDVGDMQIERGQIPHMWTPDGAMWRSFDQDYQRESVELRLARGSRRMCFGVSAGQLEKPIINRTRTLSRLTANYVAAMDAYFLRRVVNTWDGPIETAHDCFATDLANVDRLKVHLCSTWREVYFSDVLGGLRDRLVSEMGKAVPRPPRSGEHPIDGLGCNWHLFS